MPLLSLSTTISLPPAIPLAVSIPITAKHAIALSILLRSNAAVV
jgi:hypothetical protein